MVATDDSIKFYCAADEKATKRPKSAMTAAKYKGPAPERRSRALLWDQDRVSFVLRSIPSQDQCFYPD